MVHTVVCTTYHSRVHHARTRAVSPRWSPVHRAASAPRGALGSVRSKALGERTSSRSGAKKCHASYARARRIVRVRAHERTERLDSTRRLPGP